MQVHYTNDAKEARICRRAQFSGAVAAVRIADSVVTGIVHSVMEDAVSEPRGWTVKIIPKEMPNFRPVIPRSKPAG
jgi:hypothetical protein